ncbi:MAG: Rieske 2Fe-2S domain-containing protein [Solirubrobacterales bacterium]
MTDQPPSMPSSDDVTLALRHCWQPVARLEDLEDGPRRAVLLGEPLAVFLTEGGEAAVVADRCAHRGALLSMGKVCGESVQCPYHGWEWAGDGSCTRIPSLADQSQIPPLARIPSYPARVHWGLVWTTLEEPLSDVPDVPWFDEDRWTWGHGTPFELPVAFGLMIENFRDVSHFAFVHQNTIGPQPEVIEPLMPEKNGLEVTLRRNMEWGAAGATEAWGSLREMGYHTIAPNFTSARMFTDDGERCLLHAARAISATESAHYWIEAGLENFDERQLEKVIAYDAGIYAEDVGVISKIETPELPLDPNAEVHTLADRFTLAYREAFLDFVNQALAKRSNRAGTAAG